MWIEVDVEWMLPGAGKGGVKGGMENRKGNSSGGGGGSSCCIKPLSAGIFVGKVCWQNKVGKF